jgi:PIN domain nuclease of toxin-antitoxin system
VGTKVGRAPQRGSGRTKRGDGSKASEDQAAAARLKRVFLDTLIVRDLAVRIGLQVDGVSFERIVEHALSLSWTRDVFDRLIVAHAQVNEESLVSKDAIIRKN